MHTYLDEIQLDEHTQNLVARSESAARIATASADQLQTRGRELTDSAISGGRTLSLAETTELRSIETELDRLREDAARHTRDAERIAREYRGEVRSSYSKGPVQTTESYMRGDSTGNTADKPARVLKRSDSFSDWSKRTDGGAASGVRLGNLVAGFLGNQSELNDHEVRALSSSGPAGLLLPNDVSSNVIDLVRARSTVFAAGATLVPMGGPNLRIPKLTSDPVANWRNESSTITDSTPSFASGTLEARSLAALLKIPNELLDDVEMLEAALSGYLAEALAGELDRAALFGSGINPEPRGLANTVGINVLPINFAPQYRDTVSAIGVLRQGNFTADGVIHSARTLTKLDGLVDSTTQPLNQPRVVAELPTFSTSKIPVTLGIGANESVSFVGEWQNLVVGVRQQISLARSTDAGFDMNETWLRAILRADVMVVRPAAFVKLEGLLP
jgi:HK97 family phage major capsid protein